MVGWLVGWLVGVVMVVGWVVGGVMVVGVGGLVVFVGCGERGSRGVGAVAGRCWVAICLVYRLYKLYVIVNVHTKRMFMYMQGFKSLVRVYWGSNKFWLSSCFMKQREKRKRIGVLPSFLTEFHFTHFQQHSS